MVFAGGDARKGCCDFKGLILRTGSALLFCVRANWLSAWMVAGPPGLVSEARREPGSSVPIQEALEGMVPQEGLEPPTLSLRRTCSTS